MISSLFIWKCPFCNLINTGDVFDDTSCKKSILQGISSVLCFNNSSKVKHESFLRCHHCLSDALLKYDENSNIIKADKSKSKEYHGPIISVGLPDMNPFYSKSIEENIPSSVDISLPKRKNIINTYSVIYKYPLCEKINVDDARKYLFRLSKQVTSNEYEMKFLEVKVNNYLELVSTISKIANILLKHKIPYRILEDFLITPSAFNNHNFIVKLERSLSEGCLCITIEKIGLDEEYTAIPYHIFINCFDYYEIALANFAKNKVVQR